MTPSPLWGRVGAGGSEPCRWPPTRLPRPQTSDDSKNESRENLVSSTNPFSGGPDAARVRVAERQEASGGPRPPVGSNPIELARDLLHRDRRRLRSVREPQAVPARCLELVLSSEGERLARESPL